MTTRYQKKPLLRLLECYVLWAIGQLKEKDKEVILKMTPHLQQTYNMGGTWQEIVSKVMDLPENMPALIVGSWEKNRSIALESGAELTSEQFAQMFVDANLR